MPGEDNSGDACRALIAQVAESLEKAGFPVVAQEDKVFTFFGVENQPITFAYVLECLDSKPVVSAGLRGLRSLLEGLPCEAREKVLLELLRIPSTYKVSIAVEDDNLTIDIPVEEDAYLTAMSGFALAASIASWLTDQVERVRKGLTPEPFKYE